MPGRLTATKEALLGELIAYVHEKLPRDQAALVDRFARQYYRGVAAEELAVRSVPDLYGAALSLWRLAATRRQGEARVGVYNPRPEDHGWRSVHTVVEIVTEDMPFVVDSVAMELNRHDLMVHLLVHAVCRFRRDDGGRLVDVAEPDADAPNAVSEACLHIEVDRRGDPAVLEQLKADLARVLDEVRAANKDWTAMRRRLHDIVARYGQKPPPVDLAALAEELELLRWLDDDRFVYLGCCAYDLLDDRRLRPVPGSGLGILRERGGEQIAHREVPLPLDGIRRVGESAVLSVGKANARSTVHRPSYLECIGVARYNEQGEPVGEVRLVGLHADAVFTTSVREIPLLRRRLQRVQQRVGFPPTSHEARAVDQILETFPRDELFQASTEELVDVVMQLLALEQRPRLRLFVRPDRFRQSLSCLVYVPRDRYSAEVGQRLAAVLAEAFGGTVLDVGTQVAEPALARLHVVVRTDRDESPGADVVAEVESLLVRASRSWRLDLRSVLVERCGQEGDRLVERYSDAFPAAYREEFTTEHAADDILRIEGLGVGGRLAMRLSHPPEAQAGFLRFQAYWPGEPPLLSEILPLLEDMGLKVVHQRPYEIQPAGRPPVRIDNFGLLGGGDDLLRPTGRGELFQEAFSAVLRGEAESDGFNRLVLLAGLSWREIAILRACCKYLRQTRSTFSQDYMEEALARNPAVARKLVELFRARFDPARSEDADRRAEALGRELSAAIDRVDNLDEDRILRSFLTLTQATLRTNFFQTDPEGRPKPYLALKLDPARVPWLPLPRPMFEVFVYSTRTEAVHLRGGKVARGGIRWSDRREDFRTEILGLMKAQMVKNAVIVPTGAKGGFVVKRPPADGGREALMDEVVACYTTFMQGLLDLTDNRVDGQVVAPPAVVRYDEDDPYLVVAADKGTATFSDLANSIAAEYGFWLDDAFASGGSAGYDHKQMGITAKGAWESVKRHFRELGVDTQTTDFTVVGIGDMAGDVFGNGMLLSRRIKLVGAFNHLHVFLDPDPDPAASFAERRRLFELPRSSWDDYDRSLLSAGGGIWPRTAKSIRLSAEARRALDVQTEVLTPNELISVLLKAPVDLLWNGGIGTYVKAAGEAHADAGDRTNDAVRVNGAELRCKVVGEGGNLGLTQLGRVEYALRGGCINTDFIDNAGGVDCSDHEVNIKILLNQVVADGAMTREQRDALLAEMTDEVAAAVVLDNYRQVQAISTTEAQAPVSLDRHARLIRNLEEVGGLDRALEFLPDDEAIAERRAAGQGFTRPEIAVLLAYSKNLVREELLDSSVPEGPYFSAELSAYFPAMLQQRFREQMEHHPLRREIVATLLSNGMVNRVGPGFLYRLEERTGAKTPDAAQAYAAARDMFDLDGIWSAVDELDPTRFARLQLATLIETRRLVEQGSLWLLRNRRPPLDVAAEVKRFAPGVATLAGRMRSLLVGAEREAMEQRIADLVQQGAPEELAVRVGTLEPLSAALDIVEVAGGSGRDLAAVASVYFLLGSRLGLDWLSGHIVELPSESHWTQLAKASLRDELFVQRRRLAAAALRQAADDGEPSRIVQAWVAHNHGRVRRCLDTLGDLRAADDLDIAMVCVALQELEILVQTGGWGEAEIGGMRVSSPDGR